MVLTLVALVGGAATFSAWLFLGQEFAYAMERAVTVMVIACPHALGLAIPLVIAVSTSLGANGGLLVRDRGAFENARAVDAVVFDKTGTLTTGRFGVVETEAIGDASREEVLRLAAAVEQYSEHPIARAIVEESPEHPDSQSFEAIPGQGAHAVVDGADIAVAGPAYLRERGIETPDAGAELAEGGRTVVYVLRDGVVIGAVALADVVRPESIEAVRQLKARGIEPIMLTGDSPEVANRVAAELGIERVFAGVLPAEKAATVQRVRDEGRVVAMVGDGVNDAPALATANVGIAIGSGTDVAVSTADIVLVRSNPRDVVTVIALAQATYRKMLQNLAWATGYNVLAIPLAAGVLAGVGIILSPAVGGVLMSASTVIVAVNARALRMPNA